MFATGPRAVGFTIVWPEGVIFRSMMTYHVQFLLLVLAGFMAYFKRAEFWHRTGSHPARWSPGPGMHALTTSSAEPLSQGRVLQNLMYTARQIIGEIGPQQKRVPPVLERILS